MQVVDTNVLVHALNADAPEHAACRARLEAVRRSPTPWFLTWSIVYEFLRITTHRAILHAPLSLAEAWAWMATLLSSPSCQVLAPTERHEAILDEILGSTTGLSGNILHDVQMATLMREHGVSRILTLDRNFHRFEFLEVLDPLR